MKKALLKAGVAIATLSPLALSISAFAQDQASKQGNR